MTTHGAKASAPEHRLVFGRRVRALREQRGYSQEALAHAAGLHRTYVSSLERGNRNVGLDNIVALAQALDVPAAVLLQEV
ncbi:helix-turn-helix domain-containing protein [Streptomyces sp. NBC_01506]|uniref:helix-turn-helix domain-containing protein n=1 Tax=Streptomyces sp. NBC_01506 TaxID=2903887 RepID=UPI00386718A1